MLGTDFVLCEVGIEFFVSNLDAVQFCCINVCLILTHDSIWTTLFNFLFCISNLLNLGMGVMNQLSFICISDKYILGLDKLGGRVV